MDKTPKLVGGQGDDFDDWRHGLGPWDARDGGGGMDEFFESKSTLLQRVNTDACANKAMACTATADLLSLCNAALRSLC
jgi:hypothetical protein